MRSWGKHQKYESRVGKIAFSRRPEVVTAPVIQSDVEQALDVVVLRRAAAGDPKATRDFYRTHVDRVYRHVARILGPQDPDIDDVVQKVFLAALAGVASFRGTGNVGSWLMGIASRRALDEARSRWRRHRWQRITERVGLGNPLRAPDAGDELTEAERYLLGLTPEQRSVFVLKEVEGYTFQEIHEMTGVGISTLHARLKAARRRLDAALREGRASHG